MTLSPWRGCARPVGVLIGKTTTPEFGTKCLTDSPLFGRTHNAWSAERSSGGSSGGAAVAVAAALRRLRLQPTAGIDPDSGGLQWRRGIKQSNGVIPHSQVQDAFGNQTYVTPMTRTVADTALMMQVMAGRMPPIPGRSEFPQAISSAVPRRMVTSAARKFCSASPRLAAKCQSTSPRRSKRA